MKVLCIFLTALAVAGCGASIAPRLSADPRIVRLAFDSFRSRFNKIYSGQDEEEARMKIFAENLKTIEEHNSKPGVSYKMAVNQFADMTDDEFRATYAGGYINMAKAGPEGGSPSFAARSSPNTSLDDLPKHVDWRDKGVITKVKNQGACGSCWAFAAAAQVESYLKLSGELPEGEIRELSPQQLVDCVPNPLKCGGTGGCYGATSQLAFSYVNLIGLASEKTYPYTSGFLGRAKACSFDAKSMKREGFVRGFETLVRNDIGAVMRHLAEVGPLAIAASATSWRHYRSGVFDGCPYDQNIEVNHAIQLVGYGTDEKEGDYWIVRNSWGTSWGENGYIRLKREKQAICGNDTTPYSGLGCPGDGTPVVKVCGMCGLLFDSSYPIGAGNVNTQLP